MKQLNVLMLEKRDFGQITSEIEAKVIVEEKKLSSKEEELKKQKILTK